MSSARQLYMYVPYTLHVSLYLFFMRKHVCYSIGTTQERCMIVRIYIYCYDVLRRF